MRFRLTFSRVRDLITLATLIIGVGFGLDQAGKLNKGIEATKRSSYVDLWNSVSAQWLDFDKIFVEHPEYQKYIYDKNSRQICSLRDHDILESISQYTLDFIDNALIVGHLIHDKEITHLDEWNIFFTGIFENDLEMCRILSDNLTSYSCFTAKLAQIPCLNLKNDEYNSRLGDDTCKPQLDDTQASYTPISRLKRWLTSKR
jgi:hypothetical protein